MKRLRKHGGAMKRRHKGAPSSKPGVMLMREIAKEKDFPEMGELADAIERFIPALMKRKDKRIVVRPLVKDATRLVRLMMNPPRERRSKQLAKSSD